jgi:lysozyme family protein
MPTFEQTRVGYTNLWNAARIRPEWQQRAEAAAAKVRTGWPRYEAVSRATGVPAALIGALHHLESNCDFDTHLHNGDSLRRRTVRVPAGRPRAAPKNGVAYTWEESAIDALMIKGLHKIKDWTIPRQCYVAESFNGWGYLRYGVNSPYLHSGTNLYGTAPNIGKFIADGVFKRSEISKQVGVIAILKLLYQGKENMLLAYLEIFATVAPTLIKILEGKNERMGRMALADAVKTTDASPDTLTTALESLGLLKAKEAVKLAETLVSDLVNPDQQPHEAAHETPALAVAPAPAPEPTAIDLLLGSRFTGYKTYLAIFGAVLVNAAAALHMAPSILTPENVAAINVFLGGFGVTGIVSKIERYAGYFAKLRAL